MMLNKRAVLKIFYYLMVADGAATADEQECFQTIGSELDSDALTNIGSRLLKRWIVNSIAVWRKKTPMNY